MNPLSAQETAEAQFLLALLQDSFGGIPSLGATGEGEYTVVPTCPCSDCVEFRDTYEPRVCTTLLAAGKAYGDDKLCHLQTKELRGAGASLQ